MTSKQRCEQANKVVAQELLIENSIRDDTQKEGRESEANWKAQAPNQLDKQQADHGEDSFVDLTGEGEGDVVQLKAKFKRAPSANLGQEAERRKTRDEEAEKQRRQKDRAERQQKAELRRHEHEKVDQLKKDRKNPNLESTLDETKSTLEKKEAEKRDISRKKTEKKLLQAKEDSRKLEWLLAKERERNISLHLGYQQELENRIKDAVEQQEMKQQALRDSEMRNLQIKLEQQEAELRRHQQEEVDQLKKDRENLESTLEETKRTLEKKGAEEREISREKTDEALLQAKEDSRKLEWLLAKEREENMRLRQGEQERSISLYLGYQQELTKRIKYWIKEIGGRKDLEQALRNLKIKLKQQEAELRRHQQEEVNRAKTQEELDNLRRKHEEELTEKKRLLGECENLKQKAGQERGEHRKERQALREALRLVDEENEELSNRVLEGASEEEIARLRAELDDTKEDLDRYMNYTVAERNFKTELNEGKKAIVTAILREEEGLMEKYELRYELFADMLLEIWINRETLYDLMFEDGGKFGSIKSEAQRKKKVEEVYQALDRIMRLMRGHADPKQNFVPYIEKEGVIGEANYDDYYMKQITKNYDKAVTDYVYRVMVKVDTNNPSGRYPEYKLWDTKADKDMPLEIAVGKLVKKLISAAPSIATVHNREEPKASGPSKRGRSSSPQQQKTDNGGENKKRKQGPTTTTTAAPNRWARREVGSDSDSDSPYAMSEDEED